MVIDIGPNLTVVLLVAALGYVINRWWAYSTARRR